MGKKNTDISRLVRPGVRGLRAYDARHIPCRVKLDANESPYPLRLGPAPIESNRYPDPQAMGLRRALGRRLGVRPSSILCGNGSDELIYYLITTFGGPVLYPTPTFSMYGIIAAALGERTVEVPLDDAFDLDLRAMRGAIKAQRPRLIFLASPNNPTGNCLEAASMLRIMEAAPGLVVVDEAYQPFAGRRGFLPLLPDWPNMVVLRTLSKVGLAALRVGYMAASEEIVGEVDKVRLPFNLNALSQAHAEAALRSPREMNAHIRAIVAERKRLMKAMGKIPGVTAYPSEANFILFRVGDAPAAHGRLLERGVLVRNLDGAIKGCLRVTVGTRGDNDIFLEALREATG